MFADRHQDVSPTRQVTDRRSPSHWVATCALIPAARQEIDEWKLGLKGGGSQTLSQDRGYKSLPVTEAEQNVQCVHGLVQMLWYLRSISSLGFWQWWVTGHRQDQLCLHSCLIGTKPNSFLSNTAASLLLLRLWEDAVVYLWLCTRAPGSWHLSQACLKATTVKVFNSVKSLLT